MTIYLPQRRPIEAVKTHRCMMRRKLPLVRDGQVTKRVRPSILGSLKRATVSDDDETPKLHLGVLSMSLVGAKRHHIKINGSDEDDCSEYPKAVQFAELCELVEIPHKNDYSKAQKAMMYNTRKQIRKAAKINTAEYQYDGWDCDSAAEEDEFVLVNGVYMHPSHARE